MSMRGTKRVTGGRPEEQPGPSGSGPGPSSAASTSKRRRAEPEHDAHWHTRQANDLKMSSIYNRSVSEAPAELFRKDLISAMKLPDNEPLIPSEYWIITDPWKQDWERGVQVPVNPDFLPAPKVMIIDNPRPPDHTDFKLPKDKYIHLTRDSNYQSEKHQLSSTPACAEAACSYDLDATDTTWLKLLNAERARAGAAPITEEQLEKVIEELEVRTWDKIQAIIKSEEGLGIEYDENVICDVCRSPDSEDGNEMVFCDSCNICVHQACYGITVIPDGQWLCRPCGDSVKPTCVLCPNLGGAMKCTPSGHKWAHVSCVLWIPEVSIGCAEKMEPITKISSIPASRWSLVCVLCRERKGACIQCSVKSCKTAYHVTCAFKHGLEMRAIIEDENADDGVKLRSYCQKHSVNSKKEKCAGSGSEEEEVKKKRRKDMTSEEKTQARAARLHEIEKEFDKHVSVKDISSHLLDVDQDAINYMYHYWKLKRRSSHNRPLLPPKSDDSNLMSHRQEQADLEKMKMFVQLRQDLERVRNLCYMVSRREKLSRSFFRQREQTFHKQVAVLSVGVDIPKEEMDAIIEANHGPSIYDRLYSHPGAADHKSDFEALLSRIAPHRADSGDDKNKDRNGMMRRAKANPYKKHYVNGARRSGSRISGISSEESESEIARDKYRSSALGSSTDDDRDPKKKNSTSPKKKVSPKTKAKIQKSPKKNDKKKKKVPQSKAMVESSTEDEAPGRGASKRDHSISTPRSSKRDKSANSSIKKEPVPSTSGILKREKDPATSKRDRLPSTSGSAKKDKDSSLETSGIKKEKDQTTNVSETIKKEKEPSSLKKEKEPVPSTSKKDHSASKTLRQLEKEMAAGRLGISGSDSDDLDLVPMRTTRSVKFPVDIYSTSSDDSSNEKNIPENNKTKIDKSNKIKVNSSPSGNDSQQSFRTKAAMKEFVHSEKKEKHEEDKPAPKKRGRKPSNKDTKPLVTVKTSISDDETWSKESKQSKQNDHPGIVPQRQAAKKASENMRSTTTGKKEETAVPERPVEDPKGKGKGKGKGKEIKSPPAKVAKKASKDCKDTISIVPQRQAAKKAAAHIKSIGSKVPATETADNTTVASDKKKDDKIESKQLDEKNKSMSNESSSSSSCSSSSSSSGSSSDEGTPAPGPMPTVKAREIKPLSRPPSVFSPPGSRPVLDLPFLDKVSRPLSSTSASSDTESSHSERSGSTSPTPKRPRRRRKGKSTSNDVSSRKAPDKKLKTSELESECGVPSAAAQGEEPGGADAYAATSARSRSATASGDMPDYRDAGPREPPAAAAAAQAAAQSLEPQQLSPQEWKTNKEPVNTATTESHTGDDPPLPPNDPLVNTKHLDPMMSHKYIKTELDSPKSISESNQKNISDEGLGLLEPEAKELERKDSHSPMTKEKPRELVMETPQTLYDSRNINTNRASISPKTLEDPSAQENCLPQLETKEKTPAASDEHYKDNNKHWLPKPPSPSIVPPQFERHGDNDKYMTDDKTFETECADKSSIKMIAKIQANLNENTMIKSPKTPIDAKSTNMDAIEAENTSVKNIKKRSAIDNAQDASQMQGVEISKSAKIPSTVNPYPNRSMFSPQQKDNELFAFDMMAVDDGFNHDDDLIKPFSSYPEFFFKEDSKEQGVQETLNLVDRLRMQLINKKPLTENSSQEQAVPTGNQNDNRVEEQMRETQHSELNKTMDNAESEQAQSVVPLETHNHLHPVPPSQHSLSHMAQPLDLPRPPQMQENEYHHPLPIPMTSNKWTPMPMTHNDPYMEREQTYEHSEQYMDETKDSVNVQYDTNSLKQSDDSSSMVNVDNSTTTTIDVETTQDAPTFDNNNSVMHGESPYMTEEKWRESKIATRRSSASSSCSEGAAAAAAAAEHERNVLAAAEHERSVLAAHMELRDAMLHASALPPGAGPLMLEIDSYPPPAYSCAVEPSMPLNQYATYPPNASPFLSHMGSLFGPGACSQLPMPSPSPLFGTSMPFAPPPLLSRQLCAAAFTSSSQNIALTTQVIAPPTPKPHHSPVNDTENTEQIRVASASPSVSVGSYENSSIAKLPDDNSEAMTPVAQVESSESSQKSETRTSPRAPKLALKFSGKSPGKSPGISPRQGDATSRSKRAANKNARSGRGRGRSKSRNHTPAMDYMGNSIQSKLVGTVYDFEEEIVNDSVDLKALRDRSKSVDVREDRRSEHSAMEASRSPQPASPQHKRAEAGERGAAGEPEPGGFPQVPLLLPGPVDMRTYQPYGPPAPAPAAQPPLAPPLDPDPPPPPPPAPPNPAPPHPDLYVPQLPKVSLSDSRNQLKVKIKGPFLDANYSSSTPTVVAPPPAPALDTPPSALNSAVAANASALAAGGSTNLRRMRKKELLRQYWTQDMNMDDPTGASMMATVPPPAQPSPLTRAVITIPKAVASMTSIPTREDYKITDTPVETQKKQKRKVSSGLSRELRHLKVTMKDDLDTSDDVKLSTYVASAPPQSKKRARLPGKQSKSGDSPPLAPKLKIKLGSNTVQQVSEELRPPKKRLAPKPSFEDLRRESMKYRKMVMADFEENEKSTAHKHKLTKSEKRKKKKDKKMKIINSDGENGTKLVIKIKLPVAPGKETTLAEAAAAAPEPVVDPIDHYDPSMIDPLAFDTPSYSETASAMRKVRTAKVTPIRLKLARSTQGTSYVMKAEEASTSAPAPAHLPDPAPAPALDKHSDVR